MLCQQGLQSMLLMLLVHLYLVLSHFMDCMFRLWKSSCIYIARVVKDGAVVSAVGIS